MVSLILAMVVFAWGLYFQQRIVPGVRIHGVLVGGLTTVQARARLQSYAVKNLIELQHAERFWRVKPEELGVGYDLDRTVAEAFAVGRRAGIGMWWDVAVRGRGMSVRFELDNEVMEHKLLALAAEIGKPPQDASVQIIDGRFDFIPEHTGLAIPPQEFAQELASTLRSSISTPMQLKPRMVAPQLAAPDFVPALARAEALISQPLELHVGERSFRVEQDERMKWVAFRNTQNPQAQLAAFETHPSPSGTVNLGVNRDAVRSHLEALSKQVDASAQPQRILVSKHKIEILAQGSPGRMLARDRASDLIEEQLLSNSRQLIDLPLIEVPAPTVSESPPAAPIAAGKVISVDLTKLLEYVYENGELIYSSKISPGINNWTPTGTFKIYAKTKKQKMSGPGYYIPNVPNILWFKGDYSIHGVYWHNDFGIRPRSHGCIGGPLVEAEWVFNWAEVGTPVVIYKS